MTIKELIEHLQKEDQNRIVVMAKDSGGNSHSPLADFWCGTYKQETTWHGEVGFEKLTPELEAKGFDKEDILSGDKALILCPIN